MVWYLAELKLTCCNLLISHRHILPILANSFQLLPSSNQFQTGHVSRQPTVPARLLTSSSHYSAINLFCHRLHSKFPTTGITNKVPAAQQKNKSKFPYPFIHFENEYKSCFMSSTIPLCRSTNLSTSSQPDNLFCFHQVMSKPKLGQEEEAKSHALGSL